MVDTMPNEEHIAILRQGADVWNAWRAENPALLPDIEGESFVYEDLSGANLSDMSFHHQVLSGATLVGTIFDRAYLGHGDLSDSDVSNASFKGADLSCANLYGSSARGADFSEAVLREVSLKDADLQGATFRGSDMTRVYLVDTDLTKACLEKVIGLNADQLAQAASLDGVSGLDAAMQEQLRRLAE